MKMRARMVMHRQSTEVTYNVQTVVDDQHHLIVEHEVTNDPMDRCMRRVSALTGEDANRLMLKKQEGRQSRRLYRATPAGLKALAAAKIKVREEIRRSL